MAKSRNCSTCRSGKPKGISIKTVVSPHGAPGCPVCVLVHQPKGRA